MRICVAQTSPTRGDIPANVDEHLRLVELAGARQASLVLFPELSLTGYEIELARECAMTERDPRLAPLVDAAASHSLTIVAGAPVRLGPALHIAAFVIDPDGAIALYTKRHLGAFGESARQDGSVPPPEASVFQPGVLDPSLAVGDVPAALAICADTGHASHVERAVHHGAKAYLASMFVIRSEYEADAERLGRYARQHELVVALANYGAPTGGLAAAGRSAIWSAAGERLVELPSGGSGIAVGARSSGGWHVETALLPAR